MKGNGMGNSVEEKKEKKEEEENQENEREWEVIVPSLNNGGGKDQHH